MPSSSYSLSARAKAILHFARSLFISQGYIWDWALVIILIRINRAFLKNMPHYKRYYIKSDASLSYPIAPCFLPHDLSWTYVFYITPAIILLHQLPALWSINYGWIRAGLDFHGGYLSLFEAYSVASTSKHILESSGKLRPDWLARLATGDAAIIKDGRESYPSGHALYPTMASTILTLYLFGKSGVLAHSSVGQFALFLICTLPMVIATIFAMDRIHCYDHDFVDAIAGSLVGCVCGMLGYMLNFHPVTHPELCGRPKERSTIRNTTTEVRPPYSEPLITNPEV